MRVCTLRKAINNDYQDVGRDHPEHVCLPKYVRSIVMLCFCTRISLSLTRLSLVSQS